MTQQSIEMLQAEIQRLKIQCEGLYTSASNNGQALILAESRIQQLTQALRDAHSMLLWCERRMMSPSIATYPKACAERIERIINELPSV